MVAITRALPRQTIGAVELSPAQCWAALVSPAAGETDCCLVFAITKSYRHGAGDFSKYRDAASVIDARRESAYFVIQCALDEPTIPPRRGTLTALRGHVSALRRAATRMLAQGSEHGARSVLASLDFQIALAKGPTKKTPSRGFTLREGVEFQLATCDRDMRRSLDRSTGRPKPPWEHRS